MGPVQVGQALPPGVGPGGGEETAHARHDAPGHEGEHPKHSPYADGVAEPNFPGGRLEHGDARDRGRHGDGHDPPGGVAPASRRGVHLGA